MTIILQRVQRAVQLYERDTNGKQGAKRGEAQPTNCLKGPAFQAVLAKRAERMGRSEMLKSVDDRSFNPAIVHRMFAVDKAIVV